jgi:hypothetical protein
MFCSVYISSCNRSVNIPDGANTSTPVGMPFGDLCPPGYYCPEGTAQYQHHPCPNGTYSKYTGNSAVDNCTRCDPGQVCAGASLTASNGICDAGYFCRGGAYTARPNDGGTTGAPCPKGHYCPQGIGKYLYFDW